MRIICCPRSTISIHALRVEGDRGFYFILRRLPISIHALRVEGDITMRRSHELLMPFLSTPSGWRATLCI